VLAAAGHLPQRHARAAPADLTEREVDVLRHIARGLTSAQTAAELGITPRTVNTHVEHIYAKIGASTRATASLFAMQHGLLPEEQFATEGDLTPSASPAYSGPSSRRPLADPHWG
jgi:DNA-binding CsgD family transcriptional regulator